MIKRFKKIGLASIADITSISLVIIIIIISIIMLYAHQSQARQSDTANTGTNQTSAYVNDYLNNGIAHRYTTSIVYDKVDDTIVYHLTPTISRELRGYKAYPHQPRATVDFDRSTLHNEVRADITHIHRHCHNKTARAKLVYNDNNKIK